MMIILYLQTISVRKCGISEDIADYYLAEMLDSQKALERELDPNEIPHDIQFGAHGLLRLYLRLPWITVTSS